MATLELSAWRAASSPLTALPDFSEAISGAGAFSIGGGGNDAIEAGTTIDTSRWIITGANTDVTLNEALSYSGTFREQPGATLTLTPSNNLTLTHSAVFTDATIGGSGTLTLAGAKVTMNGGTIGADASIALLSGTLSATGTIANSGTLFASGGTVVVAGAVNGVMVGVAGRNRAGGRDGERYHDIERRHAVGFFGRTGRPDDD